MAQMLSTVHLSNTQKEVLVTIKMAPTPQVAFEELTNKPQDRENNIIGAKKTLEQLGLIDMTQDTAEVTEQGEQVMQDANLIDEMGELTPEAEQLVQGSENPQQQAPAEDPMGDLEGMGDEEAPFESLKLIASINESAEILKQLKKKF